MSSCPLTGRDGWYVVRFVPREAYDGFSGLSLPILAALSNRPVVAVSCRFPSTAVSVAPRGAFARINRYPLGSDTRKVSEKITLKGSALCVVIAQPSLTYCVRYERVVTGGSTAIDLRRVNQRLQDALNLLTASYASGVSRAFLPSSVVAANKTITGDRAPLGRTPVLQNADDVAGVGKRSQNQVLGVRTRHGSFVSLSRHVAERKL